MGLDGMRWNGMSRVGYGMTPTIWDRHPPIFGETRPFKHARQQDEMEWCRMGWDRMGRGREKERWDVTCESRKQVYYIPGIGCFAVRERLEGAMIYLVYNSNRYSKQQQSHPMTILL